MGTDNSVLSSVISLKYIELDRIKVSAKHNASSSKSPSPKINLDEEEEDLLDAQLNYFFFERTALDKCVSIDIVEKIQDYGPGRP